MRIVLNGIETDVEPSATVNTVVRSSVEAHAACAVEVNKRLVPARHHADHVLNEGDEVEIVTLVGGG